MSLVILYLGAESQRFPTEDDAKKIGAIRHTEGAPARIEITPAGGGPIVNLSFDPESKHWGLCSKT